MDNLRKKVIEYFEPYQPIAHDIKHGMRTALLAKQIARSVGYDETEAEAAGLLHDIGRTVKNSQIPHGHEGAPIAKDLLDRYTDFSEDAKKRIVEAIYVHSDHTTEGTLNQILQDADKLDGLGAIGISRAYTSHYNKPDFDPHDILPVKAAYGSTTTAHDQIRIQMNWYGMLYTEEARRIGRPRYEYMRQFIEEFKREVAESD